MSLVELARYSDASLAHIVKGRLEAAGISAHVFDTGMNFAEGVPMLFQVRVMVLDEDLEAARAVLEPDGEPVSALEQYPEADSSGPSPTVVRRRRLGRWIIGYIVFFLVLALLVDLFLPAQPPSIEVEQFD